MPLVGTGHSLNLVGDEAPYFTSLEELDSWMDKPSKQLRSVVPYTPRSRTENPQKQGQLLVGPIDIILKYQVELLTPPQVCHDYKVKPIHDLRTAFSCKLFLRVDTMRNLRRSHIPLIFGHTVKRLSSKFRFCL
jgi:hypothetical protein